MVKYENLVGIVLKTNERSLPITPGSLGLAQISKQTHAPMRKYSMPTNARIYI